MLKSKKLVPLKKADGKKYLDQSRYPKIVTDGYEKEFKYEYADTIANMMSDLIEIIT